MAVHSLGVKREEKKKLMIEEKDGIIDEPTSLRTQETERVVLEYEKVLS